MMILSQPKEFSSREGLVAGLIMIHRHGELEKALRFCVRVSTPLTICRLNAFPSDGIVRQTSGFTVSLLISQESVQTPSETLATDHHLELNVSTLHRKEGGLGFITSDYLQADSMHACREEPNFDWTRKPNRGTQAQTFANPQKLAAIAIPVHRRDG
jgi:hypothetical protein